jgi:hypothetical protein
MLAVFSQNVISMSLAKRAGSIYALDNLYQLKLRISRVGGSENDDEKEIRR